MLQDGIREQATNFVEQAIGQAAFGNVAVCAVIAAFLFQRGALDFGINDHAQRRVCAAEFLSGLKAVEARHAEIEQSEIGLVLRDELDGVDAIAGGADDFEAAGEVEVVADGTECGG